MIPKVAGSGHSFEGAGQYYLHDKLESQRLSDADRLGEYALHDKDGRQTSFRVGFTAMLNMAADTPQQAIAQMTASYERYRQREANKRGRKLVKPVYAYSLAWAPDQTPSRDEMMSAARSSLKALRLDGLQTLIIQHTDEPHPHVHVIVNRIELDGSRARNIPFDHLRFSRWAEQYERDHGGIRCEQRVTNNELRRQGIMVRDSVSLTRAEITSRERLKAEVHAQMRQVEAFHLLTHGAEVSVLIERHKQELAQLDRTTRERMASNRKASKAKFAPDWRALYAEQHTLSQSVRAAIQGGILERACFVMSNRELLRKGGRLGIREIARFALSAKALTTRIEHIQAAERAKLAATQQYHLEGVERAGWRSHAKSLIDLRIAHQREAEQIRTALRSQTSLARLAGEPEKQRPLPGPPLGTPPHLSKGKDLRPGEVDAHLRSASPLRDAHGKSVEKRGERDRSHLGGSSPLRRTRERRPDRDR